LLVRLLRWRCCGGDRWRCRCSWTAASSSSVTVSSGKERGSCSSLLLRFPPLLLLCFLFLLFLFRRVFFFKSRPLSVSVSFFLNSHSPLSCTSHCPSRFVFSPFRFVFLFSLTLTVPLLYLPQSLPHFLSLLPLQRAGVGWYL